MTSSRTSTNSLLRIYKTNHIKKTTNSIQIRLTQAKNHPKIVEVIEEKVNLIGLNVNSKSAKDTSFSSAPKPQQFRSNDWLKNYTSTQSK
jgi:hypothetical protein